MMATQSGIGSPELVRRHPSGNGRASPFMTSSRSRSSMTCWVPTLRARSRP